jgi:glycosyltransferase involved in cell wall biosynthesis
MPKISIILPVYNGEKHLRESLDSVLEQSYRDFELIAWDDGSSDRSREIIGGYRDPRIAAYKNTHNSGLFPTLNSAIRKAEGPFIRLWGQDDIMKPYCLEREIIYFEPRTDCALAYSAYDVIDDDGRVIKKRAELTDVFVVPPDVASEIMFYYGDITGNIANITIRRSVLEEAGFFREDMLVSGDFEFLVRLAASYSFCEIHQPLIYLRSHAGQFSHQKGVFNLHMRENEELHAQLAARLKHLDPRYVRTYDIWNRHVCYVHYAVRRALIGDFQNAAIAYRHIRTLGQPSLALLAWLSSANGRLKFCKPRHSRALAAHFARAMPKFTAASKRPYSEQFVCPSMSGG